MNEIVLEINQTYSIFEADKLQRIKDTELDFISGV
jgi:hypothetical protein